jgi:TRAP-type mannitol/chloroaromatic compound transport system permease small subunit
MNHWLRFVRAIDRLNEAIGHAIAWLTLAMVLLAAGNAVARYLGRFIGWNLSSNAYLELQWYLFSAVFLLGAAYALRRGAHVRVDVFYSRLSTRGKAWVDLLGTLLMLLPFCALSLWLSWPSVSGSWAIRETSPDPGGLARYPIKSLILVCFALLLLQGIAEAVRQVAILRGEGPVETGRSATEEPKEQHL